MTPHDRQRRFHEQEPEPIETHWYLMEQNRKATALRRWLVDGLRDEGGATWHEITPGPPPCLTLVTGTGKRWAIFRPDMEQLQRLVNYLGELDLMHESNT